MIMVLLVSQDLSQNKNMAAEKEVDYEFVQRLPRELTCSICMKVSIQPHLVNCCEKQFCKRCLDKWSMKNKSCPLCRSEDFSTILLKQKSRKIGELKVYCPNKQHGCKEELKIVEYADHLSATNDKGCLYTVLNCPIKCEAKVFRGEMEQHTQAECPRRPVHCKLCNLVGKHQFVAGDHVKECPMLPLPCPLGCGEELVRKGLDAHRDACPLEPVPCPFSEFGCKVNVARKDQEKHMETSMAHHMTSLAKSHATLQAEHAALAKSHMALQAEYATLQENLEDIVSVLKTARQNSVVVPQIYKILADTSSLTIDSSPLQLYNPSKKSGHHYIILSQQQPESEYKFKLEWKKDRQYASGFTLKLSQIISETYPALAEETKFTVKIVSNDSTGYSSRYGANTYDTNCLSICCGKSAEVSGDDSLQLIATKKLNHPYVTMNIQFKSHVLQECMCQCHTYSCTVQEVTYHVYRCSQCKRQYNLATKKPNMCCNMECQHYCTKDK